MDTGDSLVPKWAFLMLLIIFLLFGGTPAGVSNCPVPQDAKAPVANRDKDLMTLEEKVAQMSVRDEVGSVIRLEKELKGYQLIHLKPRQVKAGTFSFSAPDLAFYDLAMNYVSEPGTFKIITGPSSHNKGLQTTTLNVNQKISHSAK